MSVFAIVHRYTNEDAGLVSLLDAPATTEAPALTEPDALGLVAHVPVRQWRPALGQFAARYPTS